MSIYTHACTHARTHTCTQPHACIPHLQPKITAHWLAKLAAGLYHAHTHARTHAHTHAHTHARTHTRSLVIVQDGVEAMGYGENRAVPKLGTNRLLDEVIRFHVNGRSGFIQHKNLCLAQKSSGQADQLTLPNTGGGGGGGGGG